MIREIVFDTETTGLDAQNGDRLVEIGAVELVNRFPTGNTFHEYVNPEQEMPQAAFDVHGLSTEFLSDKPAFAHIAQRFVHFIGDSVLVAHNASFDIGFLNAEFARIDMPMIEDKRVVDTLMIARQKHPAGPNSLDALCARYNIDNAHRLVHGALLDAQLLTEVYIELLGGRQGELSLNEEPHARDEADIGQSAQLAPRAHALAPRIDDQRRAAHRDYVSQLIEEPLWQRYFDRRT